MFKKILESAKVNLKVYIRTWTPRLNDIYDDYDWYKDESDDKRDGKYSGTSKGNEEEESR